MPRKTPPRTPHIQIQRRFNEAAARCRGKRRSTGTRSPPAARFNEAAARCRGKPGGGRAHPAGCPPASMRPRPDAAENGQRGDFCHHSPPASMRPRPDAAENSPAAWYARPALRCFNEAAARCRGKLTSGDVPIRLSMSFNEAAARCRGKLPRPWRTSSSTRCFNEAAARCRGKPTPAISRFEGENQLQ